MRKSRRTRSLVAKCCLALVPLLALEVSARLAHTVLQDVRDSQRRATTQWYRFSPTVHWERRPGFAGSASGAFREFDSHGMFTEDADDVSEPDVDTILLIGDSCTFGHGVAVSNTFGVVLETLVPSTRVINMGVPGYSSFQGLKLLEASIPRLKPDIVVISFNFNDRRYTLGPGPADSAANFRSTYIANRLGRIIGYGSYSYRALRSMARKIRPRPEPPSVVEVDRLWPRVTPEDHRDNILRMAEISKRQGAIPVFVALGDNPASSRDVYDAIALYSEGSSARAIEALRRCCGATNSWTTLARTYLRRAAKEAETGNMTLPDLSTAEEYKSSLHGGSVIETDAMYHEMAKSAAISVGMAYVDAQQALDARPEVFVDACHFNGAGHRIVAEELAAALMSLRRGRNKDLTDGSTPAK